MPGPHVLLSGGIRSRVLSNSFCFRDGLEKVEVGFGVSELVELLDLQTSVFVGDDIRDEDIFASHVYPE